MTSAETEKGKPLAIHGLMAEFGGPEALLEAARRSFAEGYRRMDAYSPFPVERSGGSHRFSQNQVAIAGPDWRDYRMRRWILLTILGFSDRLSDEHRWPAFE